MAIDGQTFKEVQLLLGEIIEQRIIIPTGRMPNKPTRFTILITKNGEIKCYWNRNISKWKKITRLVGFNWHVKTKTYTYHNKEFSCLEEGFTLEEMDALTREFIANLGVTHNGKTAAEILGIKL